MTFEAGTTLIVEAHFAAMRVTGVLRNLAPNRRLVDVLSTQEPGLELHTAEVRRGPAAMLTRFPSLQVRKDDLVYAIPRETAEQVRARAMSRTGMMTPLGQRAPITVMTPCGVIAGTVTLPPGMNLARIEMAMLPNFFALAAATITDADGNTAEEEVAVVNRGQVVALARAA